MPSGSKLCTVVVNWNRANDTVECIRSLRLGGVEGNRIIVIDNGSTDESATRIVSECPEAELHRMGRNLGYAKGANAGMTLALADRPDFIFFLNNDAVVGERSVLKLIEGLQRHPDCALAGPKILYYGTDRIWFAGGSYNHILGYSKHPGMDRQDDGGGIEGKVDFITGCASMVRRELIERIGGFDEDFNMYAEDIEYGFRAREAGFGSLYVPGAVVSHKVSSSTGVPGTNVMTPQRSFYYARNMILFVLKRIPWPERFTCFMGQFAISLPYYSAMIAMQRVKGGLGAYLRGIGSALKWAVSRDRPGRSD
ncbi:MAG: glycosyltransferase family 2 protein [Methanomassiliicoccales archaeon]|nr:glycosyltransferase family 2 protein [Methanomassiliicoccales archaeon]